MQTLTQRRIRLEPRIAPMTRTATAAQVHAPHIDSIGHSGHIEPSARIEQTATISITCGTRSEISETIFDQWLQQRRAYVEGQGWCFGEDFDRYDAQPHTLHAIAETGGSIVGGLRLTRVQNFTESLSSEMLTPEMYEVASKAFELNSNRELWDLTRLIPSQGMRLAPRQQLNILCELFGHAAATAITPASGGPRWIFATTGAFFRVATRSGLFFNEITRSTADNLAKEVVLCSVQPLQAIQELLDRKDEFPESAESLLRGMRLGSELNVTA